MDNGTFCSAFWKHTNLRPGDRIYPCCRFKDSIGTFNGDLINLLDITEYKSLREKSLSGEKISGCEKCYYEESIGHKSLRQEFNEKYSADVVSLEYLEIGIDNLCNLACIGCNSEFSTRWIQKEIEQFGKASNKYIKVSDMISIPESINKILFLGGEPLLTERSVNFLKQVPNPSTVEVIFNTNATVIPNQEMLSLLQKMLKVHFIVSIDGIDEVAQKVREGTDWSKVLEFINWLYLNQFTFEFNTVLHNKNWDNIREIANFVKEHNVNWYVNMLTYPKHLDTRLLTDVEKSKLVASISDLDIPNKDFISNHLFQTMS